MRMKSRVSTALPLPLSRPTILRQISISLRAFSLGKCLHSFEPIIPSSLPLLNRSCGTRLSPPDTVSSTSGMKPTRTSSTSQFFKASQTRFDFEFSLGCSLFAKRTARPFPPPFASNPSDPASNAFSSFHFSRSSRFHRHADAHYQEFSPQTTTSIDLPNREIDKLQLLRGVTNGDDAVIMSALYLGVADGVGAWNTRPYGRAALWSRLLLHFWSMEVEDQLSRQSICCDRTCDTVEALQQAYQTVRELTPPWQGTTTACLAMMTEKSTLTVLNLGDSQCFVFRPKEERIVLKTVEQWHWFDCPRQLGSNSRDTPREHAVVSKLDIEDGDVVILATDGLSDNLWEHEILEKTSKSLRENNAIVNLNEDDSRGTDSEVQQRASSSSSSYHSSQLQVDTTPSTTNANANNVIPTSSDGIKSDTTDTKLKPNNPPQLLGKMQVLADTLVSAAKEIATDPFAESPYMERCIEQGLVIAGGKLDDISVVVGECRRKMA